MGKYDSSRDEILDLMIAEGFATHEDGDVEGPVGWFAQLDLTATALPAILADLPGVVPAATNHADLVGHFVCRQDSAGFFYVAKLPDRLSAATMFDYLAQAHNAESWAA